MIVAGNPHNLRAQSLVRAYCCAPGPKHHSHSVQNFMDRNPSLCRTYRNFSRIFTHA